MRFVIYLHFRNNQLGVIWYATLNLLYSLEVCRLSNHLSERYQGLCVLTYYCWKRQMRKKYPHYSFNTLGVNHIRPSSGRDDIVWSHRICRCEVRRTFCTFHQIFRQIQPFSCFGPPWCFMFFFPEEFLGTGCLVYMCSAKVHSVGSRVVPSHVHFFGIFMKGAH